MATVAQRRNNSGLHTVYNAAIMSLGDRLGIAGLVVAFFGIGITVLWPDQKWIGWLCLGIAGLLILLWFLMELRILLGFIKSHPKPIAVLALIIGASSCGFLAWRKWMNNPGAPQIAKQNEPKSEEPKREPPKVENPPTVKKKSPVKPVEKSEPFSVSVEWAMFSYGGKGYGTGFWAYYPSQNGCSISPIQAVFFVRVKNLRSTPVTVIGYSLDVFGVPLIRTHMGNIVRIPQKGSIVGPKKPSGYPIEKTINFGQGPGFSIVHFALDESDFTQGFLLQMDLVENLLKAPLQPNIPIRGWAFYQSPNENAFSVAGPGHITLETDDSHTFSYDFDLRNPHPELDILDRVIFLKSFIDLSDCKHP
ncbi:MAG TPA: hypothetical protein VGR03_09260 [Candidatus Acidoferrum sp.]|nr:hypothetical protein [Candidatus Acidoferrum sp.]